MSISKWISTQDHAAREFFNGLPTVSAHIAQSVEHFLGKEEVTGSNPVMGSSFILVSTTAVIRGHQQLGGD